jgi:hypothetical protein
LDETLSDEIQTAAEKLSMQADQSSQLIDEYDIKYVQESKIHAGKLQVQASRLQK